MQAEHKTTLTVVIVTILLVAGGLALWGKSVPDNTVTVDNSILLTDDAQYFKKDIKDAKVMLVEFADYQCPACAAAHPIIKQVLENYKDDNNFNFVFRNFPLPQHKNAIPAAKTAEAAGIQGKYWEMYDMIYEHQKDWENVSNPETMFESYASTLKLDMTKFKADIKSDKVLEAIENGITDANKAGVNATPTFFLNGKKYDGAYSVKGFEEAIDALLAQ